jgi:hypothetical protein
MMRVMIAVLFLSSLLSCSPWDNERNTSTVPDRYRFLYGGMVMEDELAGVRSRLPYDRITVEVDGSYWCQGRSISLFRDGRARLEEGGEREGKVSIFDFGRLCYLLEHVRFESFDPRYAWDGYDGGTVRVKVWPAGSDEPRVVEDYGSNAPIELWAVQSAIEGVAGRVKWKEK